MYYIESHAGAIMGVFEGDTPEEAVANLDKDAGGESSLSDWIVIKVASVAQHEAGTVYELENGRVVLEYAPCCYRCYRSYQEAIEDYY